MCRSRFLADIPSGLSANSCLRSKHCGREAMVSQAVLVRSECWELILLEVEQATAKRTGQCWEQVLGKCNTWVSGADGKARCG